MRRSSAAGSRRVAATCRWRRQNPSRYCRSRVVGARFLANRVDLVEVVLVALVSRHHEEAGHASQIVRGLAQLVGKLEGLVATGFRPGDVALVVDRERHHVEAAPDQGEDGEEGDEKPGLERHADSRRRDSRAPLYHGAHPPASVRGAVLAGADRCFVMALPRVISPKALICPRRKRAAGVAIIRRHEHRVAVRQRCRMDSGCRTRARAGAQSSYRPVPRCLNAPRRRFHVRYYAPSAARERARR